MATALAMMATLGLNTADFVRGLKTAEDSAGDTGEEVAKGFFGLGSAGTLAMGAVAVGAVAVVTAIVAVGVGVGLVVSEVAQLAVEAAKFEGTRMTFSNLTAAIGGTAEVTAGLREATGGMVADTDLWAAANKFLLMGLTETADETAAMAEMASQLGMAMGGTATESMENFALMMANQSIPRLDSFGISSGIARQRIEEMMAADENLTKEMAFSAVVMEMGAEKMAIVGDQSATTAGKIAKWDATMENIKTGIGQGFIPVLDTLLKVGQPVVAWLGVELPAAAAKAGEWINRRLMKILWGLGQWWADFWPKAKALFKSFWDTAQPLLDLMRRYFEGFSSQYLPAFSDAWDNIMTGFDILIEIWESELRPALEDLWESLGLGEIEAYSIGEAIGAFAAKLVDIMATDAILDVIRMVEDLTAAIQAAIKIVDDFRGAWDYLSNTGFTSSFFANLSPGATPWFGEGGDFMVHQPTLIGVGDKGTERVTVTPAGGTPATGLASASSTSTTEINITANYPQQSETSLAQDLQLLQMLTAGG